MAPLTFHLIPHTHWDREWYLPEARLGARLAAALDALPAHDGAEPFLLDGQAQLAEDFLRRRPARRAALAELVRARALQVGPWLVLPDGFVPSGEALLRNLELGRASASALGGVLPVMYAPDAFGHPAALPWLACEFGMVGGVVWRGLASRRDLVRWRAPDGSELVVHHLSRDGYEVGAALPADATGLAAAWPALRRALVGRAATRHVAVMMGADHHAPRADIAALRDRLAALEPEATVVVSRLDEYLIAAQASAGALPVATGELRDSPGHTWSLQGVHGTRLPRKRRGALLELALERHAEPLSALARLPHAGARLDEAWRPLVLNQFHDTAAGTVADMVAREQAVRQDRAEGEVRELLRDAVDALAHRDADAAIGRADGGGTLLCWNPRATPQAAVVVTELTTFRSDVPVGPPGGRRPRRGHAPAPPVLHDGAGRPLATQLLGRRTGIERRDAARHYPDADLVDVWRVALRLPTLPGLGGSAFSAGAGKAPDARDGARARGRTIENGVLRVTVRPDGRFDLLRLADGTTLRGLGAITAQADAGDCYTQAPRGWPVAAMQRVRTRVLAPGPLVAAIALDWRGPGVSGTTVIELRMGDPLLRLSLQVDNTGDDRRLWIGLPLDRPGPVVRVGTAFGTVERAAAAPSRWKGEAAVPTAPAQRFVAARAGTSALAVLAPGHFEYAWRGDGEIGVTLLRSTGVLSRSDLRERPGHAGWPTATPEAQCHGRSLTHLALAVLPGAAVDAPATVHEQWEGAFLLPFTRWFRGERQLAWRGGAVALVGDGLVVSAVRPGRGDGELELRAVNLHGEPVRGRWNVSPAPARAERRRADGTVQEVLRVTGAGAIAFTAPPHGVVTVVVR